MFQILDYIQFLGRSTNQYGVHSPFVYDLVTRCFYDRTDYQEYDSLKAYKQALLQKSTSLEVHDFGSGSQVFKSPLRSIRAMAKTAGTTKKRARLLYRLTRYFKPQHILELGTSLGIGTQALAMGCPKSGVLSLEGCPNLSEFTRNQLVETGIDNATILTGAFDELLPELKTPSYDLVFIDGHHTRAATLRYFEMLLPKVHNDSLLIFDDIHWSKGMREAWEIIKTHPKVTVTIDTFFWGFVFFRKKQAKENFTIRL